MIPQSIQYISTAELIFEYLRETDFKNISPGNKGPRWFWFTFKKSETSHCNVPLEVFMYKQISLIGKYKPSDVLNKLLHLWLWSGQANCQDQAEGNRPENIPGRELNNGDRLRYSEYCGRGGEFSLHQMGFNFKTLFRPEVLNRILQLKPIWAFGGD